MQYHSEFNHHQRPLRDRTPWFVAEVNDDPTVVDAFRRYALLRERLVPYLADGARAAIATGAPLMRGLFVDWPHDAAVWDWAGEFLLGDDLLVHPVTSPGATTWDTYLPAGDWVDVRTGEKAVGRALGEGVVVTRDVPRDVVPVYARASAWGGLAEVFAGE
jgi:alpha-glucosidase (family GH31 glycosyl hydrolase)